MSLKTKLAIALFVAIPAIMGVDIAMSGCITAFRPQRVCGDDALQSAIVVSVLPLIPVIIILIKVKMTKGRQK